MACTLIIGGLNNNNNEEAKPIEFSKYQTFTNRNENTVSEVYLTHIYTVKSGDTLESLSNDCNTSVHMLKTLNNKYSDNINTSLAEFASKYDTNIDDLITLNEEAIINDNGVYAVLSDYLYVPKFITKEQLIEKKSHK